MTLLFIYSTVPCLKSPVNWCLCMCHSYKIRIHVISKSMWTYVSFNTKQHTVTLCLNSVLSRGACCWLDVFLVKCLNSFPSKHCLPVSDVLLEVHNIICNMLVIDSCHTMVSMFARRVFTVAGPSVWNSLLDILHTVILTLTETALNIYLLRGVIKKFSAWPSSIICFLYIAARLRTWHAQYDFWAMNILCILAYEHSVCQMGREC